MRLQYRISLAAGAVIAAVASTVGGLAVSNSYSDALDTVDSQLERMVIEINTTKSITVTSALDVLSANNERPILSVIDETGQSTVLSDDSDGIFQGIPQSTVVSALDQPQTFIGQHSIRVRSINIQNNEVLLMGLSLTEIDSMHDKQQQQLWTVVLTSALLGWGLIGFLIRPELARIRKLIESVSDVAEGNLALQITTASGNSEVAQLSQALKLMLNKLQLALDNERKSQEDMAIFFGDVSHELRTPLTVIKGYAELLQNTQASTSDLEQRGFAQMRSEIDRMETLINDLMLLNELRMDDHKTPSQELVDLNELVGTHVETLNALQPQRQITVNLETRIDLQCERAHVERLFTNIFSNIQRHTPEAAPISITFGKTSTNFIVTFDDGGPGLPSGIYEKGINHFQRFDKSRSRQTGGSGLGMSIIAALVDTLHGQVDISQSPLGGLQTRILLPIVSREI